MRLWLIQLLKPYRGRLAGILAIQLSMAIIIAIQPLYMQQLVGVMLGSQELSAIFRLALILAGLFGVVTIFQGIGGFQSARFSSDLLKQLQTDFFSKTASLPLNYFQRTSSGEFFTRFNHDVGQTQSFIANTLPTFIKEVITVSMLLAVLLWFCPLNLIAAGVIVIGVSVMLAIQCHRIMDRFAHKQRSGWSEINRHFDETVRGIDTIKTFGAEEHYKNIFQQQTEGFRTLSARAGEIAALFSPAIDLATRLGGLGMAVLAYVLIVGNQLGIETFLLFFFCFALLQSSVRSSINLYTQMPQELVGIRNLALFFGEQGENEIGGKSIRSESSVRIDRSVPISFSGLYFSYPGGEELYGGKSFDIPANSITLVQGANGSGKSTLINLLLGFNEPSAGNITIGGMPLSGFSRKELRDKISVVTQYHHIFNGTLRDNLLVANSNATDKELVDSIRLVGLEYLVERHVEGLGQILDSSGKVISGGERQRICIARIFLRKTPILVLDEPWANLDNVAGRVLIKVLERLKEHCTIVAISHQIDGFQLRYKNLITLDQRSAMVRASSLQDSDNLKGSDMLSSVRYPESVASINS